MTIIIGGGFSGLSTALQLLENGQDVTVIEQRSRVGGLGTGCYIAGGSEMIDDIYHHIFTSDKHILELIDKLKLTDKLIWREPNNALYINNKLYPFTSPFDLLKFAPLPIFDRIRTGVTVLLARFINDYSKLESEYARDWLIRHSGRTSYELLWKPLLYSKFDVDADKVSAVWFWNKFKLRGSSRKGVASELLGYYDGSFDALAQQIKLEIKKRGGTILCDTTALSIVKGNDSSFTVNTDKGDFVCENVVCAIDTHTFAELCGEIPFTKREKTNLSSMKYKANICVLMALKKPLSNYYWTTVCDDKSPFVGVIEHSNLISGKDYGGHIVYLTRYLDESDPLYSASDDKIIELFCDYLHKMYPDFNKSDIIDSKITRSRFSQPVIGLHYSQNRPVCKTSEKGIYNWSMAQIYPEDRGLNYAVKKFEGSDDFANKHSEQ